MTITISIWSDIACPWCFVGKQRLEAALAIFNQQADVPPVAISWRAFELDPRPKEKSSEPYVQRLAKKYGRSVEQAQHMLDTMTSAIAEAGGKADFSRIVPANTFNAHRLIQWAGETQGESANTQQTLTDVIMRAYLGEGADLSNADVLTELARKVGLNTEAAAAILATDQYAERVREDEQEAQQLGITGVPFFVIGRYGVSGAQATDTLLQVLNDVKNEQLTNTSMETQTDAQQCDEDSCAP